MDDGRGKKRKHPQEPADRCVEGRRSSAEDDDEDVEFASDKNSPASSSSCTHKVFEGDASKSAEVKSSSKRQLRSSTSRKRRMIVSGGGEVIDGDTESTITGVSSKDDVDDRRPSREELDEFFAEQEREIQIQTRRLMAKYNYDFFKDEPLEGRFEWSKHSSS